MKYGSTTVICKQCGARTVIENEHIKTMGNLFCCPGCGNRMTAYEHMKMMAHFMYMLFQKAHEMCKGEKENFDFEMIFFPHFEAQTDGTGENRTDQGVIT